MWAEVRKEQGWEQVGEVFESCSDEPGCGNQKTAHPYDTRSYDLFGILADVRNGSGFGGCDLGDGFIPIVEPRGVPDDASPAFKEEVESWGGNAHSTSWITVKELLEYDWNQTTKKRGYVLHEEAKRMSESGGCPEAGHCGWTNRPGYTQAEWSATYRDCVERFVDEVIPQLQALGAPEDVRIVFFFDN